MTDDQVVSLRDYIEARLTEVSRAAQRELAVIQAQLDGHSAAHAREHQMTQEAVTRAYTDVQAQIKTEHDFLMHHNDLIQRAVDKAETTTNTRLEGMNEFRDALTSQSAEMARREYVDQVVAALNGRLDEKVAGLITAGLERARVTNVRVDEIEKALSARLDVMNKALGERLDMTHRELEGQANKWSNLEGRVYMISAVMGFVIFLVTIVGFVMRELVR